MHAAEPRLGFFARRSGLRGYLGGGGDGEGEAGGGELESAGGLVAPLVGGVVELSAGAPVVVAAEESVEVAVVVVVPVVSGFLLHPPKARLEAASRTPVASSAERQDVGVMSVVSGVWARLTPTSTAPSGSHFVI